MPALDLLLVFQLTAASAKGWTGLQSLLRESKRVQNSETACLSENTSLLHTDDYIAEAAG